MNHGTSCPVAVDAPSLEVFKAILEGTLNVIQFQLPPTLTPHKTDSDTFH